MLERIRRWFSGKVICRLCEHETKSKNADEIVFEYGDGKRETWRICPKCAAELELLKYRDPTLNYDVRIEH